MSGRFAGWRLGAALFIATLWSCGGDESGGGVRPRKARTDLPDIVVVLIDTLRADHLGLYGYEKETSPFLTQLAETSVVFDRAYSTSSWTAPSTASVMTGLYPPRHGVIAGFHAQTKTKALLEERGEAELQLRPIPKVVQTLPERLRELGYRTLGAAGNINIGDTLGFSRGFDEFELLHKDDAPVLVDRIRRWLAESPDGQPTFVYLHLNDVHKPYTAHEPWYEADEGRHPSDDHMVRYDSEIAFVDQTLAAAYDELGWGEDTIFCAVTDHGEEFNDHGSTGHRFSLYGELNRVLMLWRGPGVGSGVVDLNVSLVDVLPTLFELVDAPVSADMDGLSLAPILRDPAGTAEHPDFAHRPVFSHRARSAHGDKALWAIMKGRWKLIEPDWNAVQELYDLSEDRREKRNIFRRKKKIVARLSGELKKFRESAKPVADEDVSVGIDAEMFEHLDALGYTGEEDEDE